MDNNTGLSQLRTMPTGIKEITFALEFLYVLREIKEGIDGWPTPKKINATSFKLKERSTVIRELDLQLEEIGPGYTKLSHAFFSAFVEHPLKGFIIFFKNLNLPLFTFSISYEELQMKDVEAQIKKLEDLLARCGRRQ